MMTLRTKITERIMMVKLQLSLCMTGLIVNEAGDEAVELLAISGQKMYSCGLSDGEA